MQQPGVDDIAPVWRAQDVKGVEPETRSRPFLIHDMKLGKLSML